MIKKSVFENELIAEMQRELTVNEQSAAINNLDKAVECLHSAVEVFEEAGMQAQADAILNILLKIAQRRVKKDRHTAGLTSEKIVSNLLDHGTEFNMANDDESINDLLSADLDQPESLDEDYKKLLELGLVQTDNDNVDDLLNANFETDELEVSDIDAMLEMDFEDEL